MTEYIYINEVGPRDGLQNQKTILDIESRTNLIKQLIEAGIPGIEVGSFVSPKAVPAMAGTGEIVKSLNIKNLEIYFDSPNTLAKKFKLRGLPTTILFNKDGLEFARIIGSIDFVDEKFIEWLSNFN